MSDTVHYKGEMQRIPREEGESDRAYAERVLKELKTKFYQEDWDDHYDYEQEDLSIFFSEVLEYKKFAFFNKEVYKVTKFEDSEDNDVFTVQDLGDGKYSFELVYYNGGMGFDEAMEDGFKNLNKK